MKAYDLLDMIGNVDDRIIAEAKERERPSMPRWAKWTVAAACLLLVAGGIFVITRPGKTTPDISGELPQISIPKYEFNGGFEGLLYYSAEELENGNPWQEDMKLKALPVFRNGSCNEAEMMAELENAAEVLDLEILETKVETNAEKDLDGTILPGDTVYSIRAITENGNLTAYAYGSLVYELPSGYDLPEAYHFTYSDTSDAEAEAVMAYLTETYSSFLNFDHPEIVLQGDYTYSGDYIRNYFAYDSSADMTERILNYNFRAAQFAPDDDGNLMLIRLNDGLRRTEKLGDYPLISAAEAKQKLLDGQYQTSVPVAMPGEKYIAKEELVYRSGPSEEILLPYYRFYVELQDADEWQMTHPNGLKTYGAYYVPAIQDEYISK